ncbi:MAG: type II secretion system F family protein, partial [Acidobacteria bacterium]|nr:type II secretion system F family protein [Acidobacteriota bacterium]
MAPLISIGLFVLLMAGISYFGYKRYARPGRVFQQLGEPVTVAEPLVLDGTDQTEDGALVRFLHMVGSQVPVSPVDAGVLRRDLIAAGYRSERAVAVFYGIKVVAAAVMFLAMVLFRNSMTVNPVLRVVLLVMGPFAGYSLPAFILQRRITARQETLRLSLPDALDLMVVSIEAGLGLDQAMQHVARELQISHKDLSDELSLVTLEMRAGKRRSEALRNLAERTDEAEIRKLVAILIQNDRFGTSMAESLRTHSDFMRVRRRQDAEERAGKVGVKLVFPIFLFILP